MKILHIVDEPYDSGIVHYGLTSGFAMKRRGREVHVAALPGRPAAAQAAMLGFAICPIERFPASVVTLRRYIEANRIDVINAHTGSSHTLAMLATRGLAKQPALVRTRGDSRPVRRTAGGSLLWKRTDGFIAATQRILTEFRQTNPHLDFPMEAVLPGIEAPPVPSAQASQEIVRVGMLARLDPVKGHAHFLEAAKLVLAKTRLVQPKMDVEFLIAGREENVKLADLIMLAQRLAVANKVRFLGHVSDGFEFMRGCDIGAISSVDSEAISRVAIEWMALGKPVVSTHVGSLPELVSEGETGFLVPPAEPQLMADCLLRLLENPELRGDFGAAARKRFESYYTLARLGEATDRFYERVVSACAADQKA